ncbi:MAG: tryptophan synthase beta chain [Planctomycetota bacterium]|jgi:tryptophan synthase beta chain
MFMKQQQGACNTSAPATDYEAKGALPLGAPGRDEMFAIDRLYGEFGGCFVAETLMRPLQDLERRWIDFEQDGERQAELQQLSRDLAGRPTPLYFAGRMSEELGLRLYLKREDMVHTGAHKLNNALGQCLLAARTGRKKVLAETGAGQHGVATATAAAALGLECEVHMGSIDARRQATNVKRMQLLGARIVTTDAGDATLKEAVGAALRAWVEDPEGAHYVLGSALGPHPYPAMVARFQRVIGDEARAQIIERGVGLPDVAVACVGGGSNAIGLFRAFIDDSQVELVGVEAGGSGVETGRHAARMQGGRVGVLHGSRSRVLCDDDGQISPTHSISAGLDYPMIGPEHAHLSSIGRARYESATDTEALDACLRLSRSEGILPALESSHALAWIIAQREQLVGRTVLLNLSGRGDKDLDTILAATGARDNDTQGGAA